MSRIFIGFVLVIVFGMLIGNDQVKDFFNVVWLIFTLLFVVFLGIHSWMDKRGMFNPGYKKKKDREG